MSEPMTISLGLTETWCFFDLKIDIYYIRPDSLEARFGDEKAHDDTNDIWDEEHDNEVRSDRDKRK